MPHSRAVAVLRYPFQRGTNAIFPEESALPLSRLDSACREAHHAVVAPATVSSSGLDDLQIKSPG